LQVNPTILSECTISENRVNLSISLANLKIKEIIIIKRSSCPLRVEKAGGGGGGGVDINFKKKVNF